MHELRTAQCHLAASVPARFMLLLMTTIIIVIFALPQRHHGYHHQPGRHRDSLPTISAIRKTEALNPDS